jgi:hypothetical protein
MLETCDSPGATHTMSWPHYFSVVVRYPLVRVSYGASTRSLVTLLVEYSCVTRELLATSSASGTILSIDQSPGGTSSTIELI